jgi:hypothetical protein
VPEANLVHSASLGRLVRTGSWEEQSRGTYTRIVTALAAQNASDAHDFVAFFLQEAKVIFSMYTQINPDLRAFLSSKGASDEEVAQVDRRVVDLLRLPDGSPFDRESMIAQVEALAESSAAAIAAGEWVVARASVDAMREVWRQVKDRDGDHSYGLIDAIVARLGEAIIGEMWDSVIRPLFNWRYSKFDVASQPWDDSLDQLMMVACESMRAHLVGVDRTGDFELIEVEDRFILRFDPCGSGGRIVRGDSIEGTGSRMEAPYNWSVSQEPHTWNHGQTGICHYCTHCIRLMEEMPIDKFGYPLRVVDPPVYPDRDPDNRQSCQWQMFKDPTSTPEEYYTRVGRTKPSTFGAGDVGSADNEPSPFFGGG